MRGGVVKLESQKMYTAQSGCGAEKLVKGGRGSLQAQEQQLMNLINDI